MSQMKATARRLARSVSLGTLALALTAAPVLAAGRAEFVQASSSHSFDQTIDSLKHAVASNGMMVMGELDQAKALSMTGLSLEGAHAFFVGNPVMGKKLFAMNAAVGAVLPARIYVWEAGGESHVGYFRPSGLLSAINPKLGMGGKMLDQKFNMILHAALQ